MTQDAEQPDPEIIAISAVHAALRNLPADAQSRVLDYVAKKLRRERLSDAGEFEEGNAPTGSVGQGERQRQPLEPESDDSPDDDGITEVGKKWMRRNSFDTVGLGALFSLGVDEIEVVAKKVPGKGKKDRLRAVALLKGVAAYLGGGAARFTHAELKEACLHYDAYDATNSTAYMKSLSSEVSGTAKTGYVLTARGLTAATELVKSLIPGGDQ
jgi:hypothetical protein